MRVILLVPRRGDSNSARLLHALDEIARGGHELESVLDPADYRQALQAVLDGLADVIVITDPAHIPAVQFVGDLNSDGGRRARPVLRPEATSDRQRRPRAVGTGTPVLPIGNTTSAPGQRTSIVRRTA